MYYIVIKHDGHLTTRGNKIKYRLHVFYFLNKTWVFDQPERAQGPIYILNTNLSVSPYFGVSILVTTFKQPGPGAPLLGSAKSEN